MVSYFIYFYSGSRSSVSAYSIIKLVAYYNQHCNIYEVFNFYHMIEKDML